MARDDLFFQPAEQLPAENAGPAPETFRSRPLAARMRPRNLDEYAGQAHILGPGQLLRRAIEADNFDAAAIEALFLRAATDHVAIDSAALSFAAAPTVFSMSAAVCAVEIKPASNCDGAR